MNKITISRIEYRQLQKQAQAYKALLSNVFKLTLRYSVDNLVGDFQKTGLYTNEFLRDLKVGLEKSSYVKRK